MSCLRGETLIEDMEIYELLPGRLSVGQFPGYKQLNISKADLDLPVRHNTASWRTALASAKGIYLITDTKTARPMSARPTARRASGAGGASMPPRATATTRRCPGAWA